MIATGAGGIDDEGVIEVGLSDHVAEDDFRGWRTADVAEADKEDLSGLGRCWHGK